jgi:hypothetical protein
MLAIEKGPSERITTFLCAQPHLKKRKLRRHFSVASKMRAMGSEASLKAHYWIRPLSNFITHVQLAGERSPPMLSFAGILP